MGEYNMYVYSKVKTKLRSFISLQTFKWCIWLMSERHLYRCDGNLEWTYSFKNFISVVIEHHEQADLPASVAIYWVDL